MTNPIPIEKLREVVKVCEKAAPGPYDLIVDSCRACIQDGKEGEYLIEHHVSIAERNANAHLFCAAPDLLEALKLYVAYRYSGEGYRQSRR